MGLMKLKILSGNLSNGTYSVVFCIVLLSGCNSYQPGKLLTDRQGGRIVTPDYLCAGGSVRTNNVSPDILYKQMNECIVREAWADATYLFALAGSTTWYDAVQVDTQFARSMHTRLLKESLDALDNLQRNKFWEHIQLTMSDSNQKLTLCKSLVELGAPTYRPNYMLLSASSSAEKPYSTEIGWKKAVNSYIGCGDKNLL